MTLRGFCSSTHEAYIGQVVQLAKYCKRSPDQLTNEEVQAYLASLIQERKLSWSTCSQAAHAFHRTRRATLARCRELLAAPAAPAAPLRESVQALMLRLTGLDIARCAVCQQGPLRRIEILAPTPDPPRLVARLNTS